MKIALNGNIVDASEAVISVYDHGFLYGLGLFETFRTYGGKPFLLDRHLDRLSGGCKELGIVWEAEEAALLDLIYRLLEHNDLSDGYFRLTVSAGEAELGLPSGDYVKPNILLLVKPIAPPPPIDDLVGRELCQLHTRRNTPEGAVRSKSLHYMNNIIAKRELVGSKASAGAEGLMLTSDGFLSEGIVSNLFFARDGAVYTPALSTGILPGITRGLTLQLAQQAGWKAEEGLYRWEQLKSADEVWMTSSIQELVPITRLTDISGEVHQVGDGRIGAMTKALLNSYRALTGLDSNALLAMEVVNEGQVRVNEQ